MDETSNDEPHQHIAIASASSGYKQGLKQTYAFWTLLRNQTTALSSIAAYAVMYADVFTSSGFLRPCSMMTLITVGQLLVVPSLMEAQSPQSTTSGQQRHNQMVYLGAYSRFLSYVAGWSVLVGELSTLSITASYRASAVMDLLGLVDPSSGWKLYPTLLIYLGTLASPTIVHLLSKQPFPRKHLFTALLNASNCLFLVFATWVVTDNNSTSSIYKKDPNPSGWTSKDPVITLSMSTLLYALYGFDGVIYLIAEVKDISRDSPSFLIWTMVMAGPVACLSSIIMWLTAGSKWAHCHEAASGYLSRFRRSMISTPCGAHIWFAVALTGLNSFMIVNVYTAGSVLIWSMR